jgi:hypothetical protein
VDDFYAARDGKKPPLVQFALQNALSGLLLNRRLVGFYSAVDSQKRERIPTF